MAYRWEFRVHGVDVHVQNEPDSIATREELDDVGYRFPNPRRNSQGARIRQNHGGNWFHFAIPTPAYLGPHVIDYWELFVWGTVNAQAELKEVHIWSGGVPTAAKLVVDDFYGPITDREFSERFYINEEFDNSLVICIYVEFEPGGEITFGGAGVRIYADAPARWG